ncbi:XRE family transcriptional regulator [Pseudonocardia sp. ICBG1293]|uniref:XRE family transcriptional regulator n=1 Tax=Pseudonocardia sp. ICBG1293 TaxID=2844382 RepID=UPI001CC9802B|nr:XRE family transcriptional regulator [Pseudonocardia sp. ICBG1293]
MSEPRPETSPPASQQLPTLAEKINQAFESIHPPGRKPYTNREVVRWLAENKFDDDSTISETYLSLLRSGERRNPTVRHLQALSRFFELPEEYFISSGRYSFDVLSDLKLLAAMRDAKIRGIAARAVDLPQDMRDWIYEIVALAPNQNRRDRDWQKRFSLDEGGE